MDLGVGSNRTIQLNRAPEISAWSMEEVADAEVGNNSLIDAPAEPSPMEDQLEAQVHLLNLGLILYEVIGCLIRSTLCTTLLHH